MLGVLNAYLTGPDAPDYQKQYWPMLEKFLRRSLPGVELREYKVALGDWPDQIDECDAYLITGSSMGAYDDVEWIKKLGQFVKQCHTRKKKMVGICFGHQLIAHYLGGKTEKAKQGWGVGVKTFAVTGKSPWMQPQLKQVSLLFSHQDQVVKLPNEADCLAQSEHCPIQMYTIGEHILSLQGHPEFTPEFARQRMDSRIEKLGKETYEAGVKSLAATTDADTVGAWIRRFLLDVY